MLQCHLAAQPHPYHLEYVADTIEEIMCTSEKVRGNRTIKDLKFLRPLHGGCSAALGAFTLLAGRHSAVRSKAIHYALQCSTDLLGHGRDGRVARAFHCGRRVYGGHLMPSIRQLAQRDVAGEHGTDVRVQCHHLIGEARVAGAKDQVWQVVFAQFLFEGAGKVDLGQHAETLCLQGGHGPFPEGVEVGAVHDTADGEWHGVVGFGVNDRRYRSLVG